MFATDFWLAPISPPHLWIFCSIERHTVIAFKWAGSFSQSNPPQNSDVPLILQTTTLLFPQFTQLVFTNFMTNWSFPKCSSFWYKSGTAKMTLCQYIVLISQLSKRIHSFRIIWFVGNGLKFEYNLNTQCSVDYQWRLESIYTLLLSWFIPIIKGYGLPQ